jgi:hypothetical protein
MLLGALTNEEAISTAHGRNCHGKEAKAYGLPDGEAFVLGRHLRSHMRLNDVSLTAQRRLE